MALKKCLKEHKLFVAELERCRRLEREGEQALSSLANVAQRLPLVTAAAADGAAGTSADDTVGADSHMGVLAFCVDTQARLLQKHFAALEKSVAFLRDIVREFPDVLRRMRGFVSTFVDLLDCIAPDDASASGTQTLYTQLEWMENVLVMYERELRRKRLLVADIEYHDASRIGRMHAHWSARGVQSCVDHRYVQAMLEPLPVLPQPATDTSGSGPSATPAAKAKKKKRR